MPSNTKLVTVEASDSGLRADQLAAALTSFKNVIDRRSTVPALSCVLLASDGHGFSVSGHDLDTELVWTTPFNGPPFRSLVPLAGLLGAVRAAAEHDGEIGIGVTRGKLFVNSYAGTVSINALDPDDYRPPATRQIGGSFSILGETLVRVIADCLPAVSSEETRYYLMGLCISPRDNGIEVAATDGHRLHVSRARVDDLLGSFDQIIVHQRAIKCLAGLPDLVGGNEVVGVSIAERQIMFELGDWLIRTILIDGTFPAYERIIPTGAKGSITFDPKAMVSALATIGRLGSKDWKPARLCPKAGQVSFKSVEDGVSFETTIISVDAEGDLPDEVGIRTEHAATVFKLRPEAVAKIAFTDAASPMLIEFCGDPDFLAVLMPMRV